jgi:hypothetical protein
MGQIWPYCLFLYSLGAKNGFYLLKWLRKKVKRKITFCLRGNGRKFKL